ncbi:SET domain-containing protein-lysine N-methyltransferase [Candidatus Roizmanbacteria bacterium]|nr:SET domain-containing protein-lysine N-methyltransferase [Candidatus Roizmanbacteria bacterium]
MYLPIKVGMSPTLKIRGILAAEDIAKDHVIERCPILLIDAKHEELLQDTTFNNYTFEWNKDYIAFVLGYGSLYNHSYKPNAKYTFNYPDKFVIFRAIKDIKEGEEIFVNYNYVPTSRAKLDSELLSPDKTYNTKRLKK